MIPKRPDSARESLSSNSSFAVPSDCSSGSSSPRRLSAFAAAAAGRMHGSAVTHSSRSPSVASDLSRRSSSSRRSSASSTTHHDEQKALIHQQKFATIQAELQRAPKLVNETIDTKSAKVQALIVQLKTLEKAVPPGELRKNIMLQLFHLGAGEAPGKIVSGALDAIRRSAAQVRREMGLDELG